MNAVAPRIDLGETSFTFSTTPPTRNARAWDSTCNSWRRFPMTNCLAGEPWWSACQSGAAVSGDRVIGAAKNPFGGRLPDGPITRSSVFLVLFVRGIGLGLVVLLGVFRFFLVFGVFRFLRRK